MLRCVSPACGIVSRVTPVHTAVRNCTRDEGRPFEVGNQVLISSHRKLLWVVIAFEIGSTGNGRNPIFNGRRQPSRGEPDDARVSSPDL